MNSVNIENICYKYLFMNQINLINKLRKMRNDKIKCKLKTRLFKLNVCRNVCSFFTCVY